MVGAVTGEAAAVAATGEGVAVVTTVAGFEAGVVGTAVVAAAGTGKGAAIMTAPIADTAAVGVAAGADIGVEVMVTAGAGVVAAATADETASTAGRVTVAVPQSDLAINFNFFFTVRLVLFFSPFFMQCPWGSICSARCWIFRRWVF